MANKPLTVRIFIKDTSTDELFRWDDLTETEKNNYRQRMADNSSRMLSDYYSAHPEQFERL